jgi:hypothetical protein
VKINNEVDSAFSQENKRVDLKEKTGDGEMLTNVVLFSQMKAERMFPSIVSSKTGFLPYLSETTRPQNHTSIQSVFQDRTIGMKCWKLG